MSIVKIDVEEYDSNEYVLFPACCYNGNKFEALKKNYPPMYNQDEQKIVMPAFITDVPRLNMDGSGVIEVTTGDVSVPCVGIWTPSNNRCLFVFTVQEIDGENLGIAYEKGCIQLSYPAMRKYKYVWPKMVVNNDEWHDKEAEIPYKVINEECHSIVEFFAIFFKNRKLMGLDDELPNVLPRNEQIRIQLDKYNTMNWYEEKGFYGVDVPGSTLLSWQSGWTGGAISSYAMMKLGGKLEYERGIKTLEHVFENQGKSGFFYANTTEDGSVVHDGFGVEGTDGFTLTRRSADVLYFLFKHFSIMEEIPDAFIEGARKCADAFVDVFNRYGQIGQYVDVETGEIRVGGSTSGALVGAGLASAYQYFGDEKYLETAKLVADGYYTTYLSKGFTTGGPAEILQCPDSESAFALLESYVELYDVTGEAKWLSYAQSAAHLCSSWVVTYNYKFPEGSEFIRLDMKSTGSVFANVQNKHSAPGICTLSGDSLIKLYEFTGEEMYFELYKEISSTISQYMSTDERPIYSWDVPKDATVHGSSGIKVPREKLPQGFICERVNLSDWETSRCVGGVFNGSCWAEVSNMLTLAENRNPHRNIDSQL
ncbi:MAG: hypothetical protein OCD02_15100 [Spirochaetaceae bacterium]